MKIDPTIFKAYDIRDIYPEKLNEEIAERVGKAYAVLTKARTAVIARDMRPSSEPLQQALIKGLNAMGVKVITIGLASTDLFYFAVYHLNADGGIMVTASHNPKQYNGLKLCRENAIPIGEGSGMEEIRDMVIKNKFIESSEKGGQEEAEVTDAFVEYVYSFANAGSITNLKVVLDPGNGMSCVVVPHILKHLKLKEIRQCFELDGNFPNHEANPLVEENRKHIVRRVIDEKADLGIAWDGDADRCFFIDDAGRFLHGDFVTGILAKRMLEKIKREGVGKEKNGERENKSREKKEEGEGRKAWRKNEEGKETHKGREYASGNEIIYDLRASRYVPKSIEGAGGKAKICRVGHAFFKHLMRKDKAIFAGEVTGHYYYNKNNEFYADNGHIPMLQILELVSELKKQGIKFSSLLDKEFRGYYISGEINSKVADKDAIMKKLAKEFADGNIYYLDGISVEYPDWHFNVRPSNTEPLLRLNVEAETKEKMENRRDRLLAIIRG